MPDYEKKRIKNINDRKQKLKDLKQIQKSNKQSKENKRTTTKLLDQEAAQQGLTKPKKKMGKGHFFSCGFSHFLENCFVIFHKTLFPL